MFRNTFIILFHNTLAVFTANRGYDVNFSVVGGDLPFGFVTAELLLFLGAALVVADGFGLDIVKGEIEWHVGFFSDFLLGTSCMSFAERLMQLVLRSLLILEHDTLGSIQKAYSIHFFDCLHHFVLKGA